MSTQTFARPAAPPTLEATDAERDGHPRGPAPRPLPGGNGGRTRSLLLLLAALVAGVDAIVVAYRLAERADGTGHFHVFWVGYALVLFASVGLAFRARSSRGRGLSLVAFGAVTFLPKLLMTFDGPRYYDEYGHWRHAKDIVDSGHLFVDTPYLPIQRYYPGLEGLTALVHGITRLGTWHSGQLVVLAAHCLVLVAIWRIAKILDLPNRAAVIAAVLYSLNPSYLYFDTQFSYESLGLPLFVGALALAIGARRAFTAKGSWGLAGLAGVSAVACTVTHHTSAAVMVVSLLLVAAFVPARAGTTGPGAARWAPWALAAAGTTFAAVWLFGVAHPTYDYIEPHVRAGITDAAHWLRGDSKRTFENGSTIETRRTLFSGSQLPLYEVAFAFLTPLLAVGAAAATIFVRRRDGQTTGRRLRLFAPFYGLTVLYLASFPLVLTATGAETAHRAWAFGYVGLALVIASAHDLWDELSARFPGRRLVVAGAAALLVLAVGGTAAGENVYYRFPGPDRFGTDTRSRSAELDDLAAWARQELPDGAKVVTDRFTGEAIIGYTGLRTPEPADYLVYRLYREGGDPDPRLREYLRANGFRYFILDRRIGHREPVQRLFPGYVGEDSVSATALARVGTTSFLRVVHRTPTYLVLRIDA